VSKREHFEHRLAQIQRLARIGFWEIDFASDTAWWSDELYRIFGLEPGSVPPKWSTMLSLLHPEDFAVVDAIIARLQLADSGDAVVHRVVRLRSNDRRIDLRGEVERDAAVHPIGMASPGRPTPISGSRTFTTGGHWSGLENPGTILEVFGKFWKIETGELRTK